MLLLPTPSPTTDLLIPAARHSELLRTSNQFFCIRNNRGADLLNQFLREPSLLGPASSRAPLPSAARDELYANAAADFKRLHNKSSWHACYKLYFTRIGHPQQSRSQRSVYSVRRRSSGEDRLGRGAEE